MERINEKSGKTLVSQSKASKGAFLCENRRLDLSAPLKGTAHEF